MRTSHTLLTCLLMLFCSASLGCSVRRAILRNELQSLQRRITACSALEQELNANPTPDTVSDFAVFIPASFINEGFRAFVGESLDLPTKPAATLTLKELTVAFTCDAANVEITAEASRKSLKVDLALRAFVTIETDPDPARGAARLKLSVEEVQPTIELPWYSFSLRGFAKDLVTLSFAKYSERLPVVTVPLRHSMQLTIPDSQVRVNFPAGAGQVEGFIAIPGLAKNATLKMRRTMFLDDGLYVYFTVN